jgi:hypothetical protein
MNFQILSQLSGFLRLLVIIGGILFIIAYLYFTYDILKNEGLNDIQRFMWLFVVTTIPVAGLVYYIVIDPSRSGGFMSRPDSFMGVGRSDKATESDLDRIRRENGLY